MSNKELVKAGHELAKTLNSDTPLIDIAKLVSDLATALDVQNARANSLAAEHVNNSGEMVRAILDGRKTQTRRVVKSDCMDIGEKDDGTRWPWREHADGGDYWYSCPFGVVGDCIWVRETWQAIHDSVDEFGYVEERTYAPSIPKEMDRYWHTVYAEYFGDESRENRGFPWRPAIHMPRWSSRITLEITGVRVERLQDISEEDAESEGVEHANFTGFGGEPGVPNYPEPDVYRGTKEQCWTECPSEAFQHLWQSIYGEGSWQANPWVWVIEFKRVTGAAQ